MTELIRLDANEHVTCTVTFPARVKRKHQHGIRKEKEMYMKRRKGFKKTEDGIRRLKKLWKKWVIQK